MTQDVETDKKTTVQIGSDILEGQMKADRELSCESTTDEIQAVCCSLAVKSTVRAPRWERVLHRCKHAAVLGKRISHLRIGRHLEVG